MKIINSVLYTGSIIVALFLSSCKKSDNSTETNTGTVAGTPTLTSAEATNVSFTSAILGGTVTSLGACAILSRGVVVSSSHSPTVNDTEIPSTDLTAAFTATATGLLPATTYYARAYAINCKGVGYGNEIHFTTLGGGAADTGYFQFSIEGVTYTADDMLGPNAGHVYPEGDTRFAYVSLDSTTGDFNVSAQSSYMFDNSKSSAFSFGFIYKPFTGIGDYTFNAASDGSGDHAVTIQLRLGTGALDPTSTNYNQYLNDANLSRHYDANHDCQETILTCTTNTLHITSYGAVGEFAEGTLSGTVYETIKTAMNCVNSSAHPFTMSFKLRRVQ